jgi:SAM-dependent methyltransferase
MNDSWSEGTGWHGDEAYGEVFFKRAVGTLPEMESSKAAASRLEAVVQPNDHLLDVGCGAGHYLRSLRRVILTPFQYTGIDVTPLYVQLGNDAFASDKDASFEVASIFDLPFPDRSFDIAMCNNVLLHLPSIKKPLEELCRVARRKILIRTLIGDRSFLIREVRGNGDEFDENDEPRQFNWYNIWSRAHIESLLAGNGRIQNVTIEADQDFDSARIEQAAADQPSAANVTRMCGEWQVNGYILQPWCFVAIDLTS